MKTIIIKKANKLVPSIYQNPFTLYSMDEVYVYPSGKATVDTGIEIVLPDNTELRFDSLGEFFIVGHAFRENRLYLCISSVLCKGLKDVRVIKPGDKIAEGTIIKQEIEISRFVDMTGGTRNICGDSSVVKQQGNKNEG